MWQAVLVTTGGRTEAFGAVRTVDARRPATAAVLLGDDDGPLVLVGHRSDATTVRVLATYLTAHQPGRLVAHAVTDHAPLAAVAALDLAVGLSRDAGHGLGAWHDLLAASWSGAVLGSVSRLTSPNPPMRQHLQSWWPGSRFLVRQGPEAASAPAAASAHLLDGVARRAHDMVVTRADDPTVTAVSQLVAPVSLRTVDVVGGWRGVYGTDETSQLALLPARPQDHVRPPGALCDGCGQHTSGDVCAFCRTRVPGAPSGTPSATSRPSTTPVPVRPTLEKAL